MSAAKADDALQLVRVADLNALFQALAELKALITQREPAIPKTYLTQEQAEEYLGCKTTWLWERRQRGRIHPKKEGRKRYYLREDLDRLIESAEGDMPKPRGGR